MQGIAIQISKTKPETIEWRKKYYQLNKARINTVQMKHYKLNRARILIKRKKNYIKNREKFLIKRKTNYQLSRQKNLIYRRTYYKKFREREIEYAKSYYKKNREQVSQRSSETYYRLKETFKILKGSPFLFNKYLNEKYNGHLFEQHEKNKCLDHLKKIFPKEQIHYGNQNTVRKCKNYKPFKFYWPESKRPLPNSTPVPKELPPY